MRITNTLKTFALASVMMCTQTKYNFAFAQSNVNANTDTFEQTSKNLITPKGVSDSIVLANAPKPDIEIAGEHKKAGIVVDINTNVLYTYDSDGKPTKAYLIASGKKSTPTDRGIRIVTHKEKFPYKGAPRSSKRRRAPRDYGPFIICLNKIDPKTGAQSSTGEFIHGCKSYQETFETNPGRYVSHGCMRMDNEAIVEVKEVKSGTIVIIK